LRDCKSKFPIILKLILGHLPIPVIGKGLLEIAGDALIILSQYNNILGEYEPSFI